MIIALLLLMNIGFAVINWGLTLGSFTRMFPYMKNTDVATTFALLSLVAGPIVFLSVLFCSLTDRGLTFQLKPTPKEERWEIFNKTYGVLGRDWFEKNVG